MLARCVQNGVDRFLQRPGRRACALCCVVDRLLALVLRYAQYARSLKILPTHDASFPVALGTGMAEALNFAARTYTTDEPTVLLRGLTNAATQRGALARTTESRQSRRDAMANSHITGVLLRLTPVD
jgi:hypothetical protein